MALAYEDGVLGPTSTVFDFGCGLGGDIRQLRQLGITATGWDPSHQPDVALAPADIVNLGFVINVIEEPPERREVVRRAWELAERVLVVSARPSWEARDLRGSPHGDGVLTGKDTFQKFYEQDELRTYLEVTLGQRAFAAAPGVFYIFRDEQQAQAVLACRARRNAGNRGARVSEMLYELHREQLTVLESFVVREQRLPRDGELDPALEAALVEELGSLRTAFALVRRATGASRWAGVDLGHPSQAERRFDRYRDLLAPLVAFVEDRGRLPRSDELPTAESIEATFGTIRSAFAAVRRVTGADRWTLVEERARRSFLVYLALAAFGGRPRFRDLPIDLQLDVRDLFGTYKNAVTEANRLLYAVGDVGAVERAARTAAVGKLTPEALYVHVSAVDALPPLLRVYEGCGAALSGTVDEATIVKLHREKPQVSYLGYPNFDRDPHPALSTVIVARLGILKLSFRDFRQSDNPPILHRKETFVGHEYPGRDKFVRLTEQEERHDLLCSATIGTRRGWEHALAEKSLELRGHQVRRRPR